jgi:uncharacterized protein YodC (DUF2158 family)
MDFEPGRIVTLKSGGPPLTVVTADGEDVRCIWFAHADDRLQEARIPASRLEPVGEGVDEQAEDEEDEEEDDKPARPRAGKRG